MTVRTGLIGSGIQASRSPAMHMTEARAQGLDLAYDLMDLDLLPGGTGAFAGLFDAARHTHLGVNITHPVKQAVLDHLDTRTEDVSLLGASNTVVFRDGRATGHNTDWIGFAESVRQGLPGAALERVVQLGAGGAGVAVAYALVKLGVRHIAIHDLDLARADALARRLAGLGADITVVAAPDGALAKADGLVNCTPTGMAIHPGLPLAENLLHPGLWVADIVYFPIWTALLRAASRIGCRTLDGGGMSLYQGMEGFRLFTGLEPDRARMAAHYRRMAEAERQAG